MAVLANPPPKPSTNKRPLLLIRHGQAVHNVMYKRLGRRVYFGKLPWQTDTELTDIGHAESLALSEPNAVLNRGAISLVLVSPLSRTLQTMSNIFKHEIESTGAFEVHDSFNTAKYSASELQSIDTSGFDVPAGEQELRCSDPPVADERVGALSPPCPPTVLPTDEDERARQRAALPVRFVATELLREYALGMAPNIRKSRGWLEQTYPWVDFSQLDTDMDEFSWSFLQTGNGRNFEIPDLDEEEGEGPPLGRIESMEFLERRVEALRVYLRREVRAEDTRVDHDVELGGEEMAMEAEEAPAIRVAAVGHSGVLGLLMTGVFPDEATALKHCFPYRFEV